MSHSVQNSKLHLNISNFGGLPSTSATHLARVAAAGWPWSVPEEGALQDLDGHLRVYALFAGESWHKTLSGPDARNQAVPPEAEASTTAGLAWFESRLWPHSAGAVTSENPI